MTEIPMDVNLEVEDHRNLQHWSKVSGFNESMLPIDMRFNQGHLLSITVYSVLLVISATGNVTVLALLIRRRRRNPTRINIMLMHLAIADLLVTFLIMPLEIAWASTVSWRAGAFMCRMMAFFRTFGLYLSSFVLVCISVDSFFICFCP
ncbi:gonadotropin-releasing hormone receptor-like [Ctenocephalides felis]|uniref:gonadotropin-releasing hormone receptor-like n=1 Tax=Ctenocephalides felis TaxID=7515 RepID=UPI000E6E4A1D|nr:gonadotropin-releasing hormone receptor-like [Ctenocephalides felis]